MTKRMVAAPVVLAAFMLSGEAVALDESGRGPAYVQGTVPLGLNYWNFVSGGQGHAGWRPDFEFGYHFSGRHDGFVLGFRQAFIVTAFPAAGGGTTQIRYGYDIPIPIGNFELTVAPFGTLGLGYVFDVPGRGGASAGLNMSWGGEAKFFIVNGFYAFGRPFEMGFQCVHDTGDCALAMVFGGGVGIAFPSP